MEFLTENLSTILTAIFTVLAALLGSKWFNLRAKFSLALKELMDVFRAIIELVHLTDKIDQDNKVTDEELAEMRAAALNVKTQIKEFVSVWKTKETPELPE
jgi:hypothetical protein